MWNKGQGGGSGAFRGSGGHRIYTNINGYTGRGFGSYGPYGRDPFYDGGYEYPGYNQPYTVYTPPYSPPMGRKGVFYFTPEELKELTISVVVLTFAFALVLGGRSSNGFLGALLPSFIAVVTGFFFHEMGHKFVAQSYGLFSEFRMSMQGLLLALFTAFIGFLIAAPGAVVISGYATREQSGKIALAGPLVNVVIAILFLPLIFVGVGMIRFTAFIVAYINAFLALFNMIPIAPLDGEKIYKWSTPHYIGLALVAFSLFVTALIAGY